MSAAATDPVGLDPTWVLLDLLLEHAVDLGYDLHGPGHQSVESRLKTFRGHKAFQLYDELGSLRKVAAALGTSEGTIRNWLDVRPTELFDTTSVRMRLLSILQQADGPMQERALYGRYVEGYGMPKLGSMIERSLQALENDGLVERTDLGLVASPRARQGAVAADDTEDLPALASDATEVLLRILGSLIMEAGMGSAEVRIWNLQLSDRSFKTLKDEVRALVMERGTELEESDEGPARPRELILGGV